jgi:hypothetical protein
MLSRLRDAIATSLLPSHQANLLAAWADAASDVLARDGLGLHGRLQQITQLRTAAVGKLLARWGKGQNVDLTALDFWDRHTTALVALAASLGCEKHLAPADLPFTDWRWTEGGHDGHDSRMSRGARSRERAT